MTSTTIQVFPETDLLRLARESLKHASECDAGELFTEIFLNFQTEFMRSIVCVGDDCSHLLKGIAVLSPNFRSRILVDNSFKKVFDQINGDEFIEFADFGDGTFREDSEITFEGFGAVVLPRSSARNELLCRIPRHIHICVADMYSPISPSYLNSSIFIDPIEGGKHRGLSSLLFFEIGGVVSRDLFVLSKLIGTEETENAISCLSTFHLCLLKELILEARKLCSLSQEDLIPLTDISSQSNFGECPPLVTIGIPTKNRLESLVSLLGSIGKQTYQNFKVLISDDGDKYDLHFELSKLNFPFEWEIISGPKINLSSNRQCIVDNASTEFVVMCKDDHLMHPSCLDELISTIIDSEDIGIVCAISPPITNPIPKVFYADVQHEEVFRTDMDGIDTDTDFWWKRGADAFQVRYADKVKLDISSCGGSCLIYRRSIIESLGGFPRDLSEVSFREDTDFSYRVHLAGYRIILNSDAIARQNQENEDEAVEDEAWSYGMVSDGLLYLNRLEWWRLKGKQLDVVRNQGTHILVLFDEVGWAWWHRAHNIQRWSSSDIKISIAQVGVSFDHNQYDFVLAFDAYLLRSLPTVPPEKLIVANSCPKLIGETREVVEHGVAKASIINNLQTYIPFRGDSRFFCCQNGVDTDLFHPSPLPPTAFRACWVGNAKSIGNKGLDLVREACEKADVELIECDVSRLAHVSQAMTQEEVRDNLYHNATVLICASQYEGTPNPALEALSCGLGVISTAVGNMPELITNGHNGYIVERSSDEIFKALVAMKDWNRDVLRSNARESILQGWTWKEKILNYETCFRELKRRALFGEDTYQLPSEEQVQEEVQAKMQYFLPLPGWSDVVTKITRKVFHIDEELLDRGVGILSNPQKLEKYFSPVGEFYLHYGDLSDLLLLLSIIPEDIKPFKVISITNSPDLIVRAVSEIDRISEVYFLDVSQHVEEARVLLPVLSQFKNCLGRGVAPSLSYDLEWHDALDIYSDFGVQLGDPTGLVDENWVDENGEGGVFDLVIGLPEVVSLHSPMQHRLLGAALLKQFVGHFDQMGYRIALIGEGAQATGAPGVIDLRGESILTQINALANAKMIVSGCQWVNVFSGLIEKEIFAFPRVVQDKGGVMALCPSVKVFIYPWRRLRIVNSFEDCLSKIDGKQVETSMLTRDASW